MESPKSDRGSNSSSPGHHQPSQPPPSSATTSSPPPMSKKQPDQPALRSFRIDDILKHTPKRSQSPTSKESEIIVRPWDRPQIPSSMAASISHSTALHHLQLSAAHHHLMNGGHLGHHPALTNPFLTGHHPSLLASSHFQRHHPYLRVPPPSATSRVSSPPMNHHINHRSRGHESIDQYEFRGTSEDGQEEEDCDGDDTRSEMSSDISITDGPSHGSSNHHRRSPNMMHGQSSSNNGIGGNGGNGNSPLDALFALTTKALDRVNNDKSAESHSKNSYKEGLSNVKKKRKSRTAFTNTQIFELEKRFLYQKYLSPADRDELASGLGLTGAQVITWFQNRRAKLKRDVEEIKKDVEATKMNFGVPTPTNVSPLIAGFDHDSFAVSKKAAELRVLMHLEQINNGKR